MTTVITMLVLSAATASAAATAASSAAASAAGAADPAVFHRILSTSTETSPAAPGLQASARSAVETPPAAPGAEIRPADRSRALQWVGVGTPPTLWRVPTPPVTPPWRFVPGVSSGSGYWPQIMGAMVQPAAGTETRLARQVVQTHGRSRNASAGATAAPAAVEPVSAAATTERQMSTGAAQLSALQPLAAAASGQTVISRLNALTSEQYRSSGAATAQQQAYGSLPALDVLAQAAYRPTAGRALGSPVAAATPSVAAERRGEAAADPGWLRVYSVSGAGASAGPLSHHRQTYGRELRHGAAAQNGGDLSVAETRSVPQHHPQHYRAQYVSQPGEVVLAGRPFQEPHTAVVHPAPQQHGFRHPPRPAGRRAPARRGFGAINGMISRLFGGPQQARQHRPRVPFFQVPPHQGFQPAPAEPVHHYQHSAQPDFRQQYVPESTPQRQTEFPHGVYHQQQSAPTAVITPFEPITTPAPSRSSPSPVVETESPVAVVRPVSASTAAPVELDTQLGSEQLGSGLFQASPQAQVQLEGVEVARLDTAALEDAAEDSQWQTEADAHAQSERTRRRYSEQTTATDTGVGTVEVVPAPGALAADSRLTPSADFSTAFLPTKSVPAGIVTTNGLGYFDPVPVQPAAPLEPARLSQPSQALDAAVETPKTTSTPAPQESDSDYPRLKSRQKTERRDDGTVIVTGALLEDPINSDDDEVVELVIEYDNDLESIVDDLLREVGGVDGKEDGRPYRVREPTASQLRRRRLSVQQLDQRLGLAHQPYYHVAMALYGLTGGRPPADAR